MDKPTSRIGGDFSSEVMEQFRNAYAKQLFTPDQDTVANNTGLPTNVIPNTSPWIEHTGLWKAHDGRSSNYQKATPFNPDDYISGDEDEDLTEEEIEEIIREVLYEDDNEDELSDEEIEDIVNEILGEEGEDDYESTGDETFEDSASGEEEEEGLTDEEIDSLINEILESE